MPSYSGLFDTVHGAPYNLLSKRSPNRYHLARLFKTRGLRELGAVLDKLLTDATPASTTDLDIYRIKAFADPQTNAQGGKRTIEDQIIVGATLDSSFSAAGANTQRAVTAADVTTIKGLFARDSGGTGQGDEQARFPTNAGTRRYPADASGNGGGGKVGGI